LGLADFFAAGFFDVVFAVFFLFVAI
jgi:hypothetical protein